MDPAQRANVEILNELEARPFNGAGGVILPFGASTVVWRPGGVSSGNVYATWAEVVAAVDGMNGEITIAVDTALAAAVIPAGAWDLRPPGVNGPVTLIGATKTDSAPFVTIANAAVTIHGLSGIRDVQLENRSTVNVMSADITNYINFYLEGFAALYQSVLAGAGVSFIACAGAAGFDANLAIYMRDFSYIGTLDGGTNAIRVAAAHAQLCIEDGAIFDTNQLVSIAGATNVVVSATQIGFVALQPYQPQASAAAIVPFGLTKRGASAILAGTGKTAAIPAFVTANSVILASLKSPVGDALTIKYAALLADFVTGNPGSFQVSALSAAGGGAINGADTSTVAWEVFTST